MKLGKIIEDLNITVNEYFFRYYEQLSEDLFSGAVKEFERKPWFGYIFESNTFTNISDTPLKFGATKKSQFLFEKLKSISFFFIVITTIEDAEKIIVPDEVFLNLEEACDYLKEALKKEY